MIARPVYPEKNILRQFLRDRLVLDHAVQEMNHGDSVPFEEQCKAGGVAIANPHHELGIPIQGRYGRHFFVNPLFRIRLRHHTHRFIWFIG